MEKDKRLPHSSEEEVDHFRVKDDATDGSVVERVFRVHGGEGVDDESTRGGERGGVLWGERRGGGCNVGYAPIHEFHFIYRS